MKKFDKFLQTFVENNNKIILNADDMCNHKIACNFVKYTMQQIDDGQEGNMIMFSYDLSCEAKNTFKNDKTMYLRSDITTNIVENANDMTDDFGVNSHFVVIQDDLDQALKQFHTNLLTEPFDIKIDATTAENVVACFRQDLETFLSSEPICNTNMVVYVVGCLPNMDGSPFYHFIELRWLHASSLQTAKELSQDEQDDISNW